MLSIPMGGKKLNKEKNGEKIVENKYLEFMMSRIV